LPLKWKHAAPVFDTIDLTDDFLRAGMENLTVTVEDIFHPNQPATRSWRTHSPPMSTNT
jgi:hypothetical protein